jgi:hypothetical protein
MKLLNESERYRALYVNNESAQAVRADVDRGLAIVCEDVADAGVVYLADRGMRDWLSGEGRRMEPGSRLRQMLTHWAQGDPARPAVLLLDEVDALVGDTLVSVLRQIRAGYAQRPAAFPQSVVLCGVRDVRDYRIHTPGQEVIAGGSPFNIKVTEVRQLAQVKR